jgi:hypothetical protein
MSIPTIEITITSSTIEKPLLACVAGVIRSASGKRFDDGTHGQNTPRLSAGPDKD